MLHNLLKKLIRTAAGRFRYFLSLAGLAIAMLLILAAVQLQFNYQALLHGSANRDSIANFLVINKDVNQAGSDTKLSREEINELAKQPFVEAVGLLTPSRFKVSAQTTSQQFPFYTDLFLESVPDAFLDVQDPSWKWDLNTGYIPLVIPNMFLDMYNFGFAVSQGTPQLTQEAIKMVPLQLSIQAMGRTIQYPARIIGFSDRISSVLVPQSFMDWANSQFGAADIAASRVIIKTSDPGDPRLTEYLRQHNLRTEADKTRFSKYRKIVNGVVSASWISGAVMFVFALLIFTLFIQLTIASCRQEIQLLVTLGTSPAQLRDFLMRQFFPVHVAVIAAVLLLLQGLQLWLQARLQAQAIFLPRWLSAYTVAAAVLVLVVLWLVNRLTIRSYIRHTQTKAPSWS